MLKTSFALRPAVLKAATVAIVALASALSIQSCMAAVSVDPHIYSSAPFKFKADRKIFNTSFQEPMDARIFSTIRQPGSVDVQNREGAPLRLREDV